MVISYLFFRKYGKFITITKVGERENSMAENEQQNIFRAKALEHIYSPEQLTDYLRVTNPGIWIILAAVVLLLAGLFSWAAIGTLETTTQAKVLVEDHTAQVASSGSVTVKEGMILRMPTEETVIASVRTDEYGRNIGLAEVKLPDGSYDAVLVTDQTKPISFLLESR